MQPLFNLLPTEIKKSKICNERQDILSQFLEQLNLERLNTKYKPLNPKVLAIKLSILSTQQLKEFYQDCIRYKNEKGSFSRRYFGGFKQQLWQK